MFCSPPRCLHAITFISFYHHFRRYKDVYGAFRHLILTWGLKLFQLRRQKALSSEITAHWVPHWAHDTRAFYKTCRLPDKKGKGAKTKGGTGRSRLAKKDWKCWTKGRDRRENVLKRWKFESPFRQSPSNNLNWSSTIIPPFECPPPSLEENWIVKRP